MKIGKIIKVAMKVAPIVYPIVKKAINNKAIPTNTTSTARRK